MILARKSLRQYFKWKIKSRSKELDKLEIDAWPQVTRFKRWKTPFRRKVITCSIHPLQVTEWLSEIDQATRCKAWMTQRPYSAVLERNLRLWIRTWHKASWKIMNSRSQGMLRWLENHKRRKGLPTLTGRQIACKIYVFFKINDVQGRALGWNDLLNIELRNENLKMFDQAWEDTLMWRGNSQQESEVHTHREETPELIILAEGNFARQEALGTKTKVHLSDQDIRIACFQEANLALNVMQKAHRPHKIETHPNSKI